MSCASAGEWYGEAMLELYHNFASTCSQKVRLVLAEKGLDYESHQVDLISGAQHDPEYVKLNPNHVVPTLVHDGRVMIESTLINEYLDDAFPETPMRPDDPVQRHAMRMWTKRIDDKVHPNAGVITFGIGTRPMLVAQGQEAIDEALAKIPNPQYRALRKSVLEHGVNAPEMGAAIRAFVAMLNDMETALADGPWLCGDRLSLADACAMPYVLRLDHLAMTPFFTADARPRVADWWTRIQALPSYATAVTEHVPEFVVEMFQNNGKEVWAEVEKLASE